MKGNKNDIPSVRIERIELQDNYFVSRGRHFSALKLIEQSKKYPVFDLPLAGIDLSRSAWKMEDLDDFIYQANRVRKTDLKYPIILDDCGCVADGLHRICKAVIMGRKTIKAIRLEVMPTPDKVEEEKED